MFMPAIQRVAPLRLLLLALLALVAILLASGLSAHGASAASWSLTETAPGAVTASGSLPSAGRARPGDFSLRLAGAQPLPASAVALAGQAGQAGGPASGIWLVLCIDRSGSMAGSFPEVASAAEGATRDALAGADTLLRVQVLPFATDVGPASEFSSAPDTVAAALGALAPQRSADSISRLYDTVAAGLRNLELAPGTSVRRLIVVSDGRDEGSVSRPQDVVAEARNLDVALDTIAYGPLADGYSASLQSLAQATGGEYSAAGEPAALAQAFRRLLAKPAPPPLSVAFRYLPAPDQSRTRDATLVYAPPGMAPLSLPLRMGAPVAAAAATVRGAAPASSEAPARAPRRWLDLRLVALLLAAVATVGVVVVVKHRRQLVIWIRTIFVPAPPPAPPQPVPPTRGRAARQATMISPSFAPPRRGQPAAWLVTIGGPQEGYRYPIEKDLVRLGAGAANELVLTGDDHISGQHASIRYESNNLYLQDLRSMNGTFLNNQRLTGPSRALAPGDVIQVGATTFELRAA